MGKWEGKGSFEKTRGRWEDNIKMDLQEMGIGFMDWIDLAQNRGRCWEFVSYIAILLYCLLLFQEEQ